jgi:hypothetical protein
MRPSRYYLAHSITRAAAISAMMGFRPVSAWLPLTPARSFKPMKPVDLTAYCFCARRRTVSPIRQNRTDRDGNRRNDDQCPLPPGPVDQGAEGPAGRHRGDASDHHDHADLAGIPMAARQETNREEGPEPVLHVCQEKIEPIERPLRLHRGPPPLISGDRPGWHPPHYRAGALARAATASRTQDSRSSVSSMQACITLSHLPGTAKHSFRSALSSRRSAVETL